MPWCFSDMKCLINVISGKNVVTELPTRISETKIQSLLKTARFWFFLIKSLDFFYQNTISINLYISGQNTYRCNPFSITIIIDYTFIFAIRSVLLLSLNFHLCLILPVFFVSDCWTSLIQSRYIQYEHTSPISLVVSVNLEIIIVTSF